MTKYIFVSLQDTMCAFDREQGRPFTRAANTDNILVYPVSW